MYWFVKHLLQVFGANYFLFVCVYFCTKGLHVKNNSSLPKKLFLRNIITLLPFIYAVRFQSQKLHKHCTVSNKAKKEHLFSFISITEIVIQMTSLFMYL